MRPLPGPHRAVRAASLSQQVNGERAPHARGAARRRLPLRLSGRLALAGLPLPCFHPMRRQPIGGLAR
jgi:hypothetical protein